jgi:hypothetical protein
VLEDREDGLLLVELREALGIPTEDLRLAIDAGLRARVIRRTGSRNSLRYLSNSLP